MVDMTKGNVVKQLFTFMIPLFIGSLFSQFYQVIDAIVVGKMVSSSALASVGATTSIIFFLTAVLSGFITGASVIVSQYFGAKDNENLKKVASTAFIIIMSMGFIISIIGVVFAESILLFLKTPQEIIGGAKIYLQIYSASVFIQCIYQYLAGVLRAIGDAKTPLYFLMLSSVLNIVLDIFFVLMLSDGVLAVSIATFLAQSISALFCGIYAMRKYEFLQFKNICYNFDKISSINITKLGIPSTMQQTISSVGMMTMQGLVNDFGADSISAYTTAYKIDNFIMLPIMSLGVALASFVAQNIGAKQYDRVAITLKTSIKLCTIFSIISSALIYIYSKELMLLFVDSSETVVISQGVDCLRALAPPFFICGILNCFTSFFRGTGDAVGAMITSVIQIVSRTAIAYSFAGVASIGINAVWWSMPIAWCIGLVYAFARFYNSKFKKIIF